MKISRGSIIVLFFVILIGCTSEKTDNNSKKDEKLIPSVTTEHIAKLTEAIEQSPDDSSLYFKWAQVHWALKNNYHAFQDMHKATLLAPSNFEYLSRYADMSMASDSIELAMEILHKCHQLKPRDIGTNINLGMIFIYLGDHKKSISYLNDALKQDIHNSET